MTELVLTIIGRDRAGIIASVSDVVRFHDGNWKHSDIAELGGRFAGVVVISVPEDRVDELLTNLVILREQGVHVTADETDGPVALPLNNDVKLSLSGTDQPGLVNKVTVALAELGIRITRVGTVTDLPTDGGSDDQFKFSARMSVPDDVAIDAVVDAIDNIAQPLGVKFTIEDLTS